MLIEFGVASFNQESAMLATGDVKTGERVKGLRLTQLALDHSFCRAAVHCD
jgi:hypothetical protein